MIYKLIHTTFWAWSLASISLVGTECPYKECQCFTTSIECVNTRLKVFPVLMTTNTSGLTSLQISKSSITVIPSKSLPPNLTMITVIDNPIATIDDAAFNGSLSSLTLLRFTGLRLTRIPNSFKYVQNLRELHLVNVPIEDWNEDAMKNIGSTLEYLHLENVNLTTPPAWLQFFSNLKLLNIRGSHLPSLLENAMDLMANSLTKLYLYNNSLTEVPQAVSKLNSLTELYLGHNEIVSIRWLPRQCNLSTLSVFNNRISDSTEFSNSLRQCNNSLSSLQVEGNLFTTIPDISFLTLLPVVLFNTNNLSNPTSGAIPSNMSYISFKNNFLKGIPKLMTKMPSLEELQLTNNSISALHAEDFPPASKLVELGYNLITELNENSFPENSSIQSLYLNNNPITKIAALAIKNLPALQDLSLGSTKLTRLPMTLSYLDKLNIFDITRTTKLICTCLEKGLEPWILRIGKDNLRGDCGVTSVYNFYANLSNSCP